MPRRRALAWLASLAAALIGACGGKQTPQALLEQAEARLAANDPAGAEQLLREALTEAPDDPNLRIVLARVEAGDETRHSSIHLERQTRIARVRRRKGSGAERGADDGGDDRSADRAHSTI